MARNNTRQSHAHATRPCAERTIPGWLWLLTGIVLGAFVMFLIHLSELKKHSIQSGKLDTPQAKLDTPAEAENDDPKRFIPEFYYNLKNAKVEVSSGTQTQTSVTPVQNSGPASPSASADMLYFLQVASFRSSDSADNLRAQLIMMNMDAKVESTKLKSGDTWHRVVVGPYASSTQRNSDREKLIQNGLDPSPVNKKI